MNANGTATLSSTGQGPYDGGDDTYVGVINNYSKTVFDLKLSSTYQIFGFDGDGITAAPYGAPGNAKDTTGYGGPLGYFTNINSSQTIGTVNFIGGVKPGGSTYFSLEEPLSAASFQASGVPEASTWAMMLIGFAGIGVAGYLRSRKASVATA